MIRLWIRMNNFDDELVELVHKTINSQFHKPFKLLVQTDSQNDWFIHELDRTICSQIGLNSLINSQINSSLTH